jgi:hypothetical protein
MSRDVPSLGNLFDAPSPLRTLLARADQLAALQRALREILHEPWAQALRVANLRGPLLILHADHAGAATALRHRQAGLIAALNQRLDLQLSGLEIKVRPPSQLGVS